MSQVCWLLNPTKNENMLRIVVAYICVTDGGLTEAYSPRFARTYLENPAGVEHKLVVVCNGGPLPPRKKAFFDGLDCEFFERPNDAGKDMSAYQDLASKCVTENSADFLVCLGESVHFHRPNWLKRWAEARMEYGSGIFGAFSSHMVRAHLNTTCFGIDARLLTKYPKIITNGDRYAAEHGNHAVWKRLIAGKNTAALVTFDGVYFQGEWRRPDNILHRGDQSNLLVHANHSERWANADPATKALWTSQSDSPYKI